MNNKKLVSKKRNAPPPKTSSSRNPKLNDIPMEEIKVQLGCSICNSQFRSKGGLWKHRYKKHRNEIILPKLEGKKNYECASCGSYYAYRCNLQQHIKRRHSEQICERRPKKTFMCSICEKGFSTIQYLRTHRQKRHHIQESNLQNCKYFKCELCERTSCSETSIRRHIKKCHPQLLRVYTQVECHTCGKKFGTKYILQKHIRSNHEEEISGLVTSRMKRCMICPLCEYRSKTKPEIVDHFSAAHNIKITYQTASFASVEKFNQWKSEIENQTVCTFRNGGTHSSYEQRVCYYLCNRTGFYNSVSTGRRHPKYAGTRKINSFCPAEIRVTFRGAEIIASYQLTHIGHGNELRYKRLNDEEREVIVRQLSSGLSPVTILERMKWKAESAVESPRRIHLVTLDDIRNIGKRAGVQSRHSDWNIDSWIRCNKSHVLYYKPFGVKDEDTHRLDVNDFVLIVMSDEGRQTLEEYGDNLVVLDRSDELRDFQLYVTCLTVVDSSKESHLCCFMFANGNNDVFLDTLLVNVKVCVPLLRTKILMTDVRTATTFDVWKKHFPVPEFNLYCPWHVLDLWWENLRLINSERISKELLVQLKTSVHQFLQKLLLQESSEEKFDQELGQFLDESDSAAVSIRTCVEHVKHVMKGFRLFLQENFLPFKRRWACCYRKDCGLSADLEMVPFSKTLQYYYFRRRKFHRLGDCLNAVTNYLSTGKEANKAHLIRKRHEESLREDVRLVSVEDEGWIVPSYTGKNDTYELYFVQRTENAECDKCPLVCGKCGVCIHTFKCTCVDSKIQANMCKHIHLVCRRLKM